jgi:hypothetical protein
VFFDALINPPEPSERLVRGGRAQAADRSVDGEGAVARSQNRASGSHHGRVGFTCGVENPDRYLRMQASQMSGARLMARLC